MVATTSPAVLRSSMSTTVAKNAGINLGPGVGPQVGGSAKWPRGASAGDNVVRMNSRLLHDQPPRNRPPLFERVHDLGAWTFRLLVVIVLTGLWALADLAPRGGGTATYVWAGAGAAAIVAVWFFRPSRLYLMFGVAALSLVTTIVALVVGPISFVGVGEMGALLVLLAWGVRAWRRPWGTPATVAIGLVLFMIPTRAAVGTELVAVEVFLAFPVAAAIGIGVYLYIVDTRRVHAMSEARTEERLEMAREIHDFVAHHVTGIVVRAQAAKFAAGDDPEASREAFGEIEKAGSEALASMRAMVNMLRNMDDESTLRPLGDIGQIPDLVERINSSGLSATCYLSPQLTKLPAEVEASAFRLVQEALTNVHKHAPSATTIRVVVSGVAGGVEVSVRDNGNGKGSRVFPSSGFGLVGISERVESLGGDLNFGPRETVGWEVKAFIPVTAGHSE